MVHHRGSGIDGLICSNCVVNPTVVSRFINATSTGVCTCCGATAPVGQAEEIAAEFVRVFHLYWEDPALETPYVDGEYITPLVWTEDAFDEVFSGDVSESGESFRQEVIEELRAETDSWADSYWRGDAPSERLTEGWELLVRTVTHEKRFFFHASGEEGWGPDLSIDQLLGAVRSSLLGRSEILPKGTNLYRVREHKPEDSVARMEDFCSPPPEKASRNRMTPRGISAFYCATDPETAVAETRGTRSISMWTTTEDLLCVDMRRPEPVMDHFEADFDIHRQALQIFYNCYRDAIRKKIRSRDSELEYLPSQVVTELIREKSEATGVLYPSAEREGGHNLVLFYDRTSFEDNRYVAPAPLRFRPKSVRRCG